MRVLVTGATGFIGGAIADALSREGIEVIRAARHAQLRVDFMQVPEASWWAPHLAGVSAVVNAVGILREQDGQTFEAMHTRAPIELFRACAAAGVRTVIQVSALGADASATSRYHLTKKGADDVLRTLPLHAAIVQPSLVYGAGGASAAMFNTLAAAPLLALPHRGAMQVQPVHIDDVVAGVLALLHRPPEGVVTIAFTGLRPIALREYLAHLRRALGIAGRAIVLPLPVFLLRWGAAIAGRIPGSFLDRETAQMLLRGNVADSASFARLAGRPPRDVDAFVPGSQVVSLRAQALLGVWLPVLRWALAAMWIWTGMVSFGLYPVVDSLALLARVGLHDGVARVALYGAAAFDLLLGVLTIALPARRRDGLWAAQLLLVAGYTALITIFLPEYWLHPYGPIVKNLPILGAIALLWSFDSASKTRGVR
jgi:uncharacterized protein YbjT (DUF2867 family)